MRKKIVAGNWKMNKNLQEGIALATELNEALAADKPNCDVVICLMRYQPHEYQARAKEFILEHAAAGLFLDMGLGPR